MDSPGMLQLLETVRLICVQHGFDREDFVSLMKSIYGSRIDCPEQASHHDLHQFVMASLKWACPPHTPIMETRRAAAKRNWVAAAEGSLPAAA